MSSSCSGVLGLVRAGVLTAALAAMTMLPLSASAQALTPTPVPTRVSLLVDGAELGSFAELTLSSNDVEPADLNAPAALKKLPGKRKPPTLTLKRGKSFSQSLLRWSAGGEAAPNSASVILYATDGTPVARYHLDTARPASLQIQSFDASKNEVSIESLELVADSIQLMQ